jgi:hypothetical protein
VPGPNRAQFSRKSTKIERYVAFVMTPPAKAGGFSGNGMTCSGEGGSLAPRATSQSRGAIFATLKAKLCDYQLAGKRENGAVLRGWWLDHTCHTAALHAGTCTGGRTCRHRRCCELEHVEVVPHDENSPRRHQRD